MTDRLAEIKARMANDNLDDYMEWDGVRISTITRMSMDIDWLVAEVEYLRRCTNTCDCYYFPPHHDSEESK